MIHSRNQNNLLCAIVCDCMEPHFISEDGGWFFWSYVITKGICNKFIEVNFCVGCMVWCPNPTLNICQILMRFHGFSRKVASYFLDSITPIRPFCIPILGNQMIMIHHLKGLNVLFVPILSLLTRAHCFMWRVS